MFPKHLIKHVKDYAATGSRVICDPPVLDTDEDYVVHVRNMKEFKKVLKEEDAGWVQGSSKEYPSSGKGIFGDRDNINYFTAFRKGELNLIVTENHTFFKRYRFATRIATALNLREKADRVTLFNMIRDMSQESIY